MNPKSLSATALQVASLCMARYAAEQVDRTKAFGNTGAADLGTVVHGALEEYVKLTQLEKSREESWELLNGLFEVTYMKMFNTVELNSVAFMEGQQMLKDWYARTDFS